MTNSGREFWAKCIADYEASGLAQDAFAARAGVNASSLRTWLYRLRRERKSAEASLTFVELPNASRESEEMDVVLVSGDRVVVRSGFDTSALERLLAVLRGHS